MKKCYPLLLALLISFGSIYAQSTFQAGYTFGSFDIPILTNIIQNPAGHYIMTGVDGILTSGTITELDSAARVVRSKEYLSNIGTEIVDVKNVSSGGYIVAGSATSGAILMRLDNSENRIWSNTYHITSGTSEYASRVLPTSDHGFVVAGYVYHATPPGGSKQDSANCYIMKVDSSGNLLWAKVIFCSTIYTNDHVLNDVAEASDGYVFAGSMSQGASDNAGTFGLVIKTDFNGNVRYIKHWGGSGATDAEATSIVSLTGTTQLVGGDDNQESFFVNLNSNTGTGAGYKYTGLFGSNVPPYLNFNAVPTFDGNYAMVGMSPLGFESYLMKVNSSNGNVIWGEQYNGGFASILPEGRQVADSGFIMVTTALTPNGYEYLVVKTNSTGTTSPAGCTPTSFSPNKASYNPTFTAFTPDSLVGSTVSSYNPLVLNVPITDTINCIKIVCTPPVLPTATASPTTICAGSPSTISGSGSGTITWNVFATATGGTSLGTAPLAVSPTTTTTYYVEASLGSGCVSTSRQAITITVNPVPASIGAMTGNIAPCIGPQAYSIASVTNATAYTWSVTGGGGTVTAGQGTTNTTVTWITAGGPYTVSVTASNSCGTVSNSTNVTVGSSPGAVTAHASPNPACVNDTVLLSASSTGATTWAWSGPNSYTSTLQNPAITGIQANQAGTYTVTASNTCGSATASVSISVNNKPTGFSASANPNPACQGQTVNLLGAATGVSTWGWSGPNGYTSASQSPSLTNIQVNQAGIYTLIATNTCGRDTGTVNVVVNTPPTALSDTATPNPVCIGTPVSLSGSATGASSYSWSGPNSFTAATQNTSVANFQNINAGVYTLSATNTCGSSTVAVTVNIATAPTGVIASANTTSTCNGNNIQLTGTATGATSYGWTGPNGFTSNRQNPGITNSTVADSGAYVFTATNTCGSTTSTVVINVDTAILGFAAASGSGDTLCAGYRLVLQGSGINVNSWTWTGPNGFVSAAQDTTVSTATFVNNGQYILTATNACGSLHDTLTINIENGSVLNLTASSTATHDSACYNDTIYLLASDSFDAYQWIGPNGFSSSQQNPVIPNAIVAQSGMYLVTASNHCGFKTDSVHIYIDTIPQGLQLSTSGTNNASCQGQSITVTASSPGVTNWAWTGPGAFTSNQASFTIQNIQPNQQGNYIVTATNGCGSKVDTIPVTVYTLPDSLWVGSSRDSICPGLSVVLTARSGLNNIVWSNSQTGDSINASQAGLYFYTAQDGNSCAVHSDTIHVYNAVAPVLNLFSSNPTSVCQGQQTVVLHASSDPSVSFTWSPGGSTADSLSVSASGEYTVVAQKNGCFVTDSVNVALAQIPSVSFADTVVNRCCINADVTPLISGNIATYQWSDTTTNSSDLLTRTGVYTVTVTSDKGCVATASVTFNKVCINAVASASPDSIHVGNADTLGVSTGFNGHFTYQWNPMDSISNSTFANPIVTPRQSTLYTVVVIDTISGCTDTSSVNVYVSYDADYGIPNVFAPNGPDQSNNNTFHIINEGDMVTVLEMRIFDRWGEVVYDSDRDKITCVTPTSGTQPTYCWDGKYQGKLQPMGNYVYSIRLKINATGAEKFLKGNLALIW